MDAVLSPEVTDSQNVAEMEAEIGDLDIGLDLPDAPEIPQQGQKTISDELHDYRHYGRVNWLNCMLSKYISNLNSKNY